MVKDALTILASTPMKLRDAVALFSPRELRTRPAPNKWSVQIILAHLLDVEEIGMRERVEAMLKQDGAPLRSVDQNARVGEVGYERQDPRRTLEAFARRRRANVKWLKTLRPAQLKHRGVHEKVGEITAEELITEWAFHDLGHLRQILEVKRYALFPRIGEMRKFYNLQ